MFLNQRSWNWECTVMCTWLGFNAFPAKQLTSAPAELGIPHTWKTDSQHPRIKLFWCQVTRWTLNKEKELDHSSMTQLDCSDCTIGTKNKPNLSKVNTELWRSLFCCVLDKLSTVQPFLAFYTEITTFEQHQHYWATHNPFKPISVLRNKNTTWKQKYSTTDCSNW